MLLICQMLLHLGLLHYNVRFSNFVGLTGCFVQKHASSSDWTKLRAHCLKPGFGRLFKHAGLTEIGRVKEIDRMETKENRHKKDITILNFAA